LPSPTDPADQTTGTRSAREQSARLVTLSLETAEDHPNATRTYQNETAFLRPLPGHARIEQATAEIHEVWAATVERGVAAGEFRSDLDARLFHRLLRDAVFLSARWYRPTPERPVERLAEELLSTFLDGFAAARTPTSR